MNENAQKAKESLVSLASSGQLATLTEAAKGMSEEDKKKAAEAIMGTTMGSPPEEAKKTLWLIVISGFAIVLVGSFLTLAISVFVAPAQGATSGQLILTVFTSVVGFLAGLFAPSPVGNSGK
jgi:hypothetical protein